MDDPTRPIIGIENRTPQEVYAIMCDRIRVVQRECEKARNKSRAFRNRLVSAMTELEQGAYEVRIAWAEQKVNEFEQAFDEAMNRERGE